MIKIEGYDYNIEVLEDRLVLEKKGVFSSDSNKIIYLKDIISVSLDGCKGDSSGSITFVFKLDGDTKKRTLFFINSQEKNFIELRRMISDFIKNNENKIIVDYIQNGIKKDNTNLKVMERVDKVENMVVKGFNGIIKLYKDKIIIERKGTMSFLTQGLKGDKTIYLSDISSIQFKNAGTFTNGYIQFSFYGGSENKGGIFDATQDENTVMFNSAQENDFIALNHQINAALSNLKKEKAELDEKSQEKLEIKKNLEISYLFEIEKLAELRDRGILTEDEFTQKKKQLLGI